MIVAQSLAALLASCNTRVLPVQPDARESNSARAAAPVDGGPVVTVIDESVVWSPDGKTIYYHRRRASDSGPAGLYGWSANGHRTSLLVEGNLLAPTHLCVSPDGSKIATEWGNQIFLIDAATGSVTQPFYTHDGAGSPTFDSAGKRLLYARRFGFFGEPLDSSGLHVFDLDTREDSPLRSGTDGLVGAESCWGPGDSLVSYQSKTPSSDYVIYVANLRTGTVNPLVKVALPGVIRGQAWGTLGPHRERGVFYEVQESGKPRRLLFAPWPRGLPVEVSEFSAGARSVRPDGMWVVESRQFPPRPYWLLYLRPTMGSAGRPAKQISFFTPPYPE